MHFVKIPGLADIVLAAGGRAKEGYAAGVSSMLVADRRWLTIWHGDWPDDTLLGLVPEVTGQRLGCQDIQEG